MSSQRDNLKGPTADEATSVRPLVDPSQITGSATAQRPSNTTPQSKSTSSGTSPRSSRASSPARQPSTAAGSSVSSPVQRTPPTTSFTRSDSHVLTASAVQKALSGAKAGPNASEPAGDTSARQQQHSQTTHTPDSSGLHWPISPRLKSPPPGNGSRRNSSSSLKQSDNESASLSQTSTSAKPSQVQSGNPSADPQAQDNQAKSQVTHSEKGASGSKLSRGASSMASKLETVQEGDHSVSPNEHSTFLSRSVTQSEKPSPEMTQHRNPKDLRQREITNLESAGDILAPRSDTEGNKSDSATLDGGDARPTRKRSVPTLTPSKVRSANEGSSKNMIVETETVSSIPQAVTNAVAAERVPAGKVDSVGSVKGKPSNETIRPKKDKKKGPRKVTNLGSGTSSTKADIFEAKVASAVDEDSTDSDETFVYESNPPETRPRQRRHHSRTPSATSVQSAVDRRGLARTVVATDQQRAVTGKRSMKFASSTYNNSNIDDDNTDEGAPRTSNNRSNLRIDPQRKNGGESGNYGTVGDADSPYSVASKQHRAGNNTNSRASSRATTPRSTPTNQLRTPTQKNEFYSEEIDIEGERADDERAPLINSPRIARTRGAKRPGTSLRNVDYYTEPRRGFFNRCVGCIVMLVTITVVVFCAAGIVIATTKPLYDVRILDIENILASEQEIMLDLLVQAVNPNVLAVTVSDMDVNIFARSKFVGTDRFWRHHDGTIPIGNRPTTRYGTTKDQIRRQKGVKSRNWQWHDSPSFGSPTYPPPHYPPSDPGGRPIDDPESDVQTMLLGRIFHFDSGLVFEASPVQRKARTSTGELRLQQPGNKTETGGTERWERVIQHPFELIVRGVLKYTLPLSGRLVKTTVSKAVVIAPDNKGKSLEDMPGFGERGSQNMEAVPSGLPSPTAVIHASESTSEKLKIRIPVTWAF